MTGLLSRLERIWEHDKSPFLIAPSGSLSFDQVSTAVGADISQVAPGEVVALVGDFDPISIKTLIALLDRGAVVMPLTADTRAHHEYFFQVAQPSVVIENLRVRSRDHVRHDSPELSEIQRSGAGGLVIFTSGSTGQPKAILHDFGAFLRRYDQPRQALRTLSFLLFDHIGGLNTLFHTLFNKGQLVSPAARSVQSVLDACRKHKVELLPTTPTFLRMLMLSDSLIDSVPQSLQMITYGTEHMDEATLVELNRLFPKVVFRQTYGMSELGIMRVRSKSSASTWMSLGGDEIQTKVEKDTLFIKSKNRMLGYLNADSPFDQDGWYNTGDKVEVDGDWLRITGRVQETINVGGLKFNPAEIEDLALQFPGVFLAKAKGVTNPITGQHCELTVSHQPGKKPDTDLLRKFLSDRLEAHKVPLRILIDEIQVSARFKKLG